MVTAQYIPKASVAGRSAFVKSGVRHYLVISIAMVMAMIMLSADGRIEKTTIAGQRPEAIYGVLLSIDLDALLPTGVAVTDGGGIVASRYH